MQWCFSASDLDDGRKWLFERRVFTEEIKKKTKEYQYFVFNKIFPEKILKKCINGIKNIIQKKEFDKGLVKTLIGRMEMVGSVQMGKNFIIF